LSFWLLLTVLLVRSIGLLMTSLMMVGRLFV